MSQEQVVSRVGSVNFTVEFSVDLGGAFSWRMSAVSAGPIKFRDVSDHYFFSILILFCRRQKSKRDGLKWRL